MIFFKSLKRFLRLTLFSMRTKHRIPITTKVGKNVKIKAKSVTIANHVTIGKNVHISCNTISIGRGVFIDDNVRITGVGNVAIGNYSIISDAVYIDGFKNCNLKIGQSSWIGRSCILNCSANLTIGNGTCVGIGSKIFTHGCWFEAAEGFSLNYQDVFIGNNVWLAVGVIVQPGSIIEDLVLVNSGAVVSGTLTSGYIYSGIPAKQNKPLREIKKEIDLPGKGQTIAYYLSARLIQHGWQGEQINELAFDKFYTFKKHNRQIKVLFGSINYQGDFKNNDETIYFLPTVENELKGSIKAHPSILIIDLTAKLSYGNKALEYLVVDLLRDSIFRFYEPEDKIDAPS